MSTLSKAASKMFRRANRDGIEKKSLGHRIRKNAICYAFALPYFLIFFTFTVCPVLISIVLSFTTFNVLEAPVFNGIENYARMLLDDDVFIIAIKNTFILAVITGPVSYLLSLAVAWLINDLKPVLRSIITVIFFAPSLSGNVLLIWTVLFSSDAYGYANGVLMNLGLINQPIRWFQDPTYMMPLVIVVVLWSSLGTSFLSFIAGLQGINRSYYEAGAIDGIRNRWQELWYITLPAMRPQLMFGAVMSIASAFSIGDVVTGLVGFPSTDYAVHTVINHLQDYGGTRYEMGYASAIATVLFVVMILSNRVVRNLLSKIGE